MKNPVRHLIKKWEGMNAVDAAGIDVYVLGEVSTKTPTNVWAYYSGYPSAPYNATDSDDDDWGLYEVAATMRKGGSYHYRKQHLAGIDHGRYYAFPAKWSGHTHERIHDDYGEYGPLVGPQEGGFRLARTIK